MNKYIKILIILLAEFASVSFGTTRYIYPAENGLFYKSTVEGAIVPAGTATGQMLYWSGTLGSWTPTTTPAGGDRIPFWDNSASVISWITVGSGLDITDANLTIEETDPCFAAWSSTYDGNEIDPCFVDYLSLHPYNDVNWNEAHSSIYWQRTGTTLSPLNSGDAILTSGIISAGTTITIPADNSHLYIGASNDIDMYHDDANSYLKTNVGGFFLQGDSTGASILICGTNTMELFGNNADSRTIMRVIPNGAAVSPFSVLEFYGTDFRADPTNYQRLSIEADTDYYWIYTSKGGSGVAKPIWLGNADYQLYLDTDVNTGSVGIGKIPTRSYTFESFYPACFDNGVTIGTEAATMIPGQIKLWSAGTQAINDFSTTFITGSQTDDVVYTLPVVATTGLLKCTAVGHAGTLTWDTTAYYKSGDSPTFVDLTLGGVITDTLLAANATGLTINGDTNPFVYAGAFTNLNLISRTINGSGTTALPTAAVGVNRTLTWDYDFTGTKSQFGIGKAIYTGSDNLVFTGDVNILTGGTPANPSYSAFGNSSTVTYSGAISNAGTGNVIGEIKGANYGVVLSSIINRSSTGTITVNSYGGYFSASGIGATSIGSDTAFNYYGGYFRGVGGTVGTSVVYGGYFTGTGGDTNYDIYAANAGSLNRFQGNIGIGKDPTVALDVTGAGNFTTDVNAATYHAAGVAGIDATVYTVDGNSTLHTLTFTKGLLTGVSP